MTQRVSYDNTPGVASYSTLGGVTVPYTTSPIHSEPFGVVRHTLDLDFRATANASMTAGIGYTRLEEERTHRLIEDTTDQILRLTFDAVGNRRFTLRTKYEHADRAGDVTEEAESRALRHRRAAGYPALRHRRSHQGPRDIARQHAGT